MPDSLSLTMQPIMRLRRRQRSAWSYGRDNKIRKNRPIPLMVASSSSSFKMVVVFAVVVVVLVTVSCGWSHSSSLMLVAASVTSPAVSLLPVVDDAIRQGHLDHLDAITMEYYLDLPYQINDGRPPADYDVAVLYYSRDCPNCQAFAPYWNRISEILHAGNAGSHLIMGLFDCEADRANGRICNRVGISHYPLIQFIRLSKHYKPNSTKRVGKHAVPVHISQYDGSWQIPDAVYDWIRAMMTISKWQRSPQYQRMVERPMQWLQQLLPGGATPRDTSRSAAESASSSSNAALGSDEIPALITPEEAARMSSTFLPVGLPLTVRQERQLQLIRSEWQQMSDVLIRGSALIDALLFPKNISISNNITKSNTNTDLYISDSPGIVYVDVFQYMHQYYMWDSTLSTAVRTQQTQPYLVMNCVMELAVDYCQRISTAAMEDWIDRKTVRGKVSVSTNDWITFEQEIKGSVYAQEPYCVVVEEECILNGFHSLPCRPRRCPYMNKAACRYATACLSPTVQQQYADALNITWVPPSSSEVVKGGREDPTPANSTTSPSLTSQSSPSISSSEQQPEQKQPIAASDKETTGGGRTGWLG